MTDTYRSPSDGREDSAQRWRQNEARYRREAADLQGETRNEVECGAEPNGTAGVKRVPNGKV